MLRSFGAACPMGTATCNDTVAVNLLLPLFPVALVLALLLAWPLARFVPHHRLLGSTLAVIGAAGYLYFSTGPSIGPLVCFLLGVIGLAVMRGKASAETTAA